ncbi:MAG: hypothetical protein HY098_04495 [Nitrospinae bacterium]|nr:hypothetical protein [Nitrospinota bacterium]
MRKTGIIAAIFAMLVALPIFATGCSGGGAGDDMDKYQSALEKINPSWKVFEVKGEGAGRIIRVEAGENVTFQDAKKAEEALHKADPKLAGYLEFFNKDVGIVLRKVELVPAT